MKNFLELMPLPKIEHSTSWIQIQSIATNLFSINHARWTDGVWNLHYLMLPQAEMYTQHDLGT
jgi:hypothetical protein